jgi:AraC-like DNA-binding protein
MLLILLVHLTVKFFLLAVLNDEFLYAQVPSGFSLAYGPLLLVIARSVLGRPMRPRVIFFQFLPFLILSAIYLYIILRGTMGNISRPEIAEYAAIYQRLLLPSLYGYPLYVWYVLRRDHSPEARLTTHIGYSLLVGVSAALFMLTFHLKVIPIPHFDMRLLPYFCYSAIPVLILRYRLRKNEEKKAVTVVTFEAAGAFAQEKIATGAVFAPAAAVSPSVVSVAATAVVDIADRRYEKSGIDAAKLDEYEAALAAFMKKSRIFLDPDLSLEGLATKMKMPKHHLTQLLNDRIKKNFYNYINEYRISEAVAQIEDRPKEVNILSLAFDCGFNSRSSFNNYFKKITGNTPSGYRKNLIPGTSPSIS